MSDHYICLQYLLFLSLIFRLCWLWRNRELVWDIVRGNLANNCFRFSFSPTKSLAMSTRVRASVLFLWTCNIMRWFSLESPVVERKYFFTRFKDENYLSLTALIAGMTINKSLKLQLPLTAVHFSRKNSTFVAELNWSLKISGGLERPLPLFLLQAWFTASGMFCQYGSSPSPSSFTTYLAILSLVSSNLHLQKYSTNCGSLCSDDSNLCQCSIRTCTLLSNSSLE